MTKKRKQLLFGLGVLGTIATGSILGTTVSILKDNINNVTLNNDNFSSKASNSNLSTSKYTPVIASQHSAPSIATDGFVGFGVGNPIIDSSGETVNDPTTGTAMVETRRAVYFTTFDGILRWKFDLNELNKITNKLVTETSSLRIVDVKPLHDFNNKPNGFLVLTTACGSLKNPGNFDQNVLFKIDNQGNLIEDSINEFALPDFGTNIRSLIGNAGTNINIISPYSIKLSYSNATTALVQISANPFALRSNNRAEKWKFVDYITQPATTDDFNVSNEGIQRKTTPVVLLEFDYKKNNFVYEEKLNNAGKKVLKNHSTLDVFERLMADTDGILPNDTYILSEMIFYIKSGILGFYGSFLLPGSNLEEKRVNISSYTSQSNKLVLNNTIIDETIREDSGLYNELFDFKNYATDFDGYTFSYVPMNYNASYNAPTATLILPYGGGKNGVYVFQIFDQLKAGSKKIDNWISDTDRRIPVGSYIDPIYGNMFIPTNDGSQIQYIDITIETSNNNSVPNQFIDKVLTNDNPSVFRNGVNAVFPLVTTNKIYDDKNKYYGKFALASFNDEGSFKVLYFNSNMTNSTTSSSLFPDSASSYSLTTYENLQKRSETLKWTPRLKKLSEITDEMLATIGSYKTVTTETPTEKLPLFYLTLAEGQQSLTPLNSLSVSDVVRNYKESSLEFNALFSYKAYTDDTPRTYTQKYSINDFKKDATIITNTVFDMPAHNSLDQPLVISSPIAYQGEYNQSYNYLAGQQTAITNGDKTLVYQLKKDKPSSVNLFDSDGSILPNILRDYFDVVKTFDEKEQTPYVFEEVSTYKGIFNSNITYQKGDVVKDSTTNRLYIFTTQSNSLLNTKIFQGTDLSTLLPTDLTENHIAMIVQQKMLNGTIPDGFSLSDILLSSIEKDNLGTTSPTGKGIITASVKLKKFIDDNGLLQTSHSSFTSVPITINFSTSSKPTSIIQEYNVSDFGNLLNGLYAYQLDSSFIEKNPDFINKLVELNQAKGYFTDDITSSSISFSGIQSYNGEGVVDLQVALSRWYDENGVLNNSELKYFFIRITGFKLAAVTQFTNNKITLKSDQLNVPGLGGLTPSEVTVSKFLSNERNIKDFILNYVNIENNTKLIIDNARPANFNENSINIVSTTPDSTNGSVTFLVSFTNYFASQIVGDKEKIVYRQGTSEPVILSISGFKKYVDNSVDTYKYNAVIDINSSLNTKASWPLQLKNLSNNSSVIPGVFYEKEKVNMPEILKSALYTLLSTEKIDSKNNLLYIQNITPNDIANVSSYFYNNFTGKIIFKANLRKFVQINSEGLPEIVDNSKIPDWQTNASCTYEISLEGFDTVSVSTVDGKELPIVNTNSKSTINIQSNIVIKDKDTLSITYNDVKDLIKWGGSFGVYNGNDFEIKTMDEIIASPQNHFTREPFINKNVLTGLIEVVFEFDKPVYYFAQKNISTDITNPYLMGNLGEAIELSKGSTIVLSLDAVKKFNVWEIVFYIGVATVAIIILSLIIFLIAKSITRRRLY